MQHEHYLQVVLTSVEPLKLPAHQYVQSYDYTAHSNVFNSPAVPVAKFHYELSPMQVVITENRRSFSHFITNVCAIIGGVFTVRRLWPLGARRSDCQPTNCFIFFEEESTLFERDVEYGEISDEVPTLLQTSKPSFRYSSIFANIYYWWSLQVAGILDGILFQAASAIKKVQLGKQF